MSFATVLCLIPEKCLRAPVNNDGQLVSSYFTVKFTDIFYSAGVSSFTSATSLSVSGRNSCTATASQVKPCGNSITAATSLSVCGKPYTVELQWLEH